MLMESFEVENFRGLKHLKLEKLAQVNLLVGKSNVGKTSVLEALVALMSGGNPAGFLVMEKERGLVGNKADFKYLFYKFDTHNPIKLSVTHRKNDADTADPQANHSITIEAANQRVSTSAIVKRPFATTELALTIQLGVFPHPLTSNAKRDENGGISASLDVNEVGVQLGPHLGFPAASRHSILEIMTTTIDREALSEKIEALKFNKAETTMLQVMKSIDPRIESIVLGAGGQIYFDLGKDFRTLLPINLMGEGIQRLLAVISSFAANANGIILIDEVDNGLHYSALRVLWKGILQAAREYDVQVFATTHSAEALRHLTWVLDEEENASYRNDVAAYTLIRADDDTVRSYRHDYEQLEYAIEHGIEVRN